MSALLFLLAQAAAQPASATTKLLLTCESDISGMAETSRSTATASDNQGNKVDARAADQQLVVQHVIIDFELADGKARLRLPAEMRDLSNGENGWFPVRDLTVSERHIAGNVRLNFLRTTTFDIDRATGLMTTKHGFRGICAPVDVTQRRF